MSDQTIPCPSCNTTIHFDVSELLKGKSFACEGCGAKIALSTESKDNVKESMEDFNKLKEN